jgi:23S rRNA (adenine2503-C2)-methyltransferase
LAKLKPAVKLAISLHATTNGLRDKLMPINGKWNIEQLRDAIEFYYRQTKLPVTYEYILFKGLNDSDEDVKRLAKFVRSVPAKVNIIPFHDIGFISEEAKELKPANIEEINKFAQKLRSEGANAFVRTSAGFDIDAACGQLAFSDRKFK